MFRVFLMLYVSSLLCNIACSGEKCELYNTMDSFLGNHCPKDGIVVPNLSWPQCKLLCLQRSGCQAVNYDFTKTSCIQLTEPCPITSRKPDMAFALFSARNSEQCVEWIPNPNRRGRIAGERLLTDDNVRYTARIQKNGNDFIGYILWSVHHCYAGTGGAKLQSKYSNDHPCQYLQVRDGCTVHYMNYELGTAVPPRALIGGYTSGGHPVYLGKFPGQKPKSYIPGLNKMELGFNAASGNIELLMVL